MRFSMLSIIMKITNLLKERQIHQEDKNESGGQNNVEI